MTTGVDGAGIGVGADLQPEVRNAAMNASANGAALYQHGAKPRVRIGVIVESRRPDL